MTRAHQTTLFALALTIGVDRAGGAEDQELNKLCPVMTEEVADPEITLTYRGKKVALCCDRCVKKFNANPAQYLPNLPQFAGLIGGFATPEESRDPPAAEPPDADAPAANAEEDTPIWGRLHPAIVHFPVAGLPLAFVGFLAWAVTGKETLAKADVVALLPAALASVAAVITGDIAEEAERFSPSMHVIAERHETLSTVVMVLALGLVILRVWLWQGVRPVWRWIYGAGLFTSSVLVGATGYLGGSLVFGPDHLKW